MSIRRKPRVRCANSGKLIRYLENEIIPDSIDAGYEPDSGTVADLKAAVKFLKGATTVKIGRTTYTRARFIEWCHEMAEEMADESPGYAEDYSEIAAALARC